MIFEYKGGDTTTADNVQSKLRELLYLLADRCFQIMDDHRNGKEVTTGELNLVRQFLKDQGIDYTGGMDEAKAVALKATLASMPDYSHFQRKYGGGDDDGHC